MSRAASERPCESTQEYCEGTVKVESTSEADDTTALSSGDCNVDKSPRYKRCFSFENSTEDNEHLIEAVSTYVLSYTDNARTGRQETPGKLSSALLSPHANGHVKDPWRPPSPLNVNKGKIDCDENPNIQRQVKNESQVEKESENALGEIMNFPSLLKRSGSLGDVLRTLSPQIGSSTSKVDNTKKFLKPAAEKEHEGNNPSKDKDGILRRILKSPALTRRGSIGNVLNMLSPNPSRCPSPSPLTIKCDTDDAQSEKRSPIGQEVSKSKDFQGSPGEARPKGLLAIVQQHVINHSQAGRNSIASTKPHTETLELSLRESLDTGEWGNESIPDNYRESFNLKTAAPIKDSLSNKNSKVNDNNNNNSVNSNNIYIESKDSAKRCGRSDHMPNLDGPGMALNHQVQGTAKASSPSDLSKSKEKSQISANGDAVFPVFRQLVGSESIDVPRVQSPQRKLSAPLPTRSVEPPQRKSSVNVIKRSPITFVIPNDKSGRTKGKVNTPDYQSSSGVGFNNSRFLPLSQEEADDYSRIKKTEANTSATTISTVIMSSRVTVHGGGGKGIVRKLGISPKQLPLNDSLPTEERFAALSERYASLKAKLQGQSKPSEKSEQSPNTDDNITQSKCWTTVESVPIPQFADHQVSDKRAASTESTLTVRDGGKQETDSEENGFNLKPLTVKSSGKEMGVIETISRTNSIEKSPNVDANSNAKPSIAKIQVENDRVANISSMANAGKTTLDFRPDSPAQRSRTSVLAKLMNRKMGPRRKQSIVPRVAKRRSKVYTESVSGSNDIPASAAQFEKIRTVVESSVLRAPVRQEVR